MSTAADVFSMTRPCAGCPFTCGPSAVPLRPGRRAEIAASLARGNRFPCHKLLDYDTEGALDDPNAVECAGARAVRQNSGTSSQLERIYGRLGDEIPEVDASTVPWRSLDDWVRHAPNVDGTTGQPDDDEDDEALETTPCEVSGPDCEAPAGWMVNGQVVSNPDADASETCQECGSTVCSACIGESGLCERCEYDNDVEPETI